MINAVSYDKREIILAEKRMNNVSFSLCFKQCPAPIAYLSEIRTDVQTNFSTGCNVDLSSIMIAA